ncbi:hypothetical protein VOLCADRAFT_95784 [Volvox carteri f. nagariensis]|uniref:Uncharacterized protein n=1 Tax=Volvox carteri f. nagariensis TaxID=3068 RepID=D8U8D5_VOLCA|nr:uncharacterized protein VOLCADRAFT_95784 [Volvox carteri f. nagariensis]EFJ43957.1 hypothetical protein VOLCADRAFT_95784 [Volvox carteri f. nagariensis]|eukprot:XP_002954969.1 hypothetical protein VOLCADRAFT_95784 [Volvox carteri f. nagariensis]
MNPPLKGWGLKHPDVKGVLLPSTLCISLCHVPLFHGPVNYHITASTDFRTTAASTTVVVVSRGLLNADSKKQSDGQAVVVRAPGTTAVSTNGVTVVQAPLTGVADTPDQVAVRNPFAIVDVDKATGGRSKVLGGARWGLPTRGSFKVINSDVWLIPGCRRINVNVSCTQGGGCGAGSRPYLLVERVAVMWRDTVPPPAAATAGTMAT